MAALLALLLIAALSALATPSPAPDSPEANAQVTDLLLYEGIIAGLRAGGDYYQVAADALRSGSYPLRPFVTFRLPVHAVVQAALPPIVTLALLYALALGVMAAWWRRLAPALARPPARVAAMLLLAGGMVVFVQSGLIAFPEVWSAQLTALALAVRRPGHWIAALALALIAMLVRETAALFAGLMLLAAWRDGERREAAGWGIALAAFALALVAHAWGVSRVVNPLDPASPGWSGLLGPGFFTRALIDSTAIQLLPTIVAAPLVAFALFGWSAWRDPLAERTLAVLLGYGAAIAIFARADTFYWALMAAPVFLAGLAFAPDALRDLWRALLDRPRVRVQRITQ
ncbi:hypothetical protein M9980_07470 [Sphingomonas donggukensis]|uniref:DUF2029 domain-containing protein n=1 Tax=Sphingomonas donggukensis TaxID=2949093 RepID=A0ABY4TSP2_9SPHN|nr:hypothetical protein [Sphingomonas donggukensis]URW74427.1 hypothetical protein M9980_07470 [Sphingomonas donggukensis]